MALSAEIDAKPMERPLSLEKARALGRYARGEIRLAEVDEQFEDLVPTREAGPRLLHAIGAILGAVLAILLVPASNRRS